MIYGVGPVVFTINTLSVVVLTLHPQYYNVLLLFVPYILRMMTDLQFVLCIHVLEGRTELCCIHVGSICVMH